jgi:hypothetical protein
MSYKRKSNRGSWQEEDMLRAIDRVRASEMSFREASRYYMVPKSTLERRAKEQNKIAIGGKKHLGRFVTTFDKEFEEELVDYAKDMESRFFGITCNDLRKLAYDLAERNKIEHKFNKE